MGPSKKGPGIGQKIARDTLNRLNRSRAAKMGNLTGESDSIPDDVKVPETNSARQRNHREISSSASLALDSYEVKPLNHHTDNVLMGFERMWRKRVLCDVTIAVGDHRIRAHKTLLATCADYFRNLFTNTPDDQKMADSEVCLEGISPSTAETLVESMYTGKIQVSEANVRELLAAASSLKYHTIEDACDEFLRRRLNKSNCLRMLNLAFVFSLSDLIDDALSKAAEHFMELANGFDFHQMDAEQLVTLISRDDVKVPSELDVFQAVLSWIEYDRKSRLQYDVALLKEVRLPLLSPSDIVDHVETVEYLMSNPACQQFVKEALHYHCLPARQSLLQSRRTCPRSRAREVVLAIGGAPRMKSDPVSRDVVSLDLETNTWSSLTQMAEPRHHLAVAVLNGFLYVAGGEETNDQRSPLNTAFRFDPRTNHWLQIASMKKRRESFQLGILSGMLYAVGGRVDEDISLAEVERYNPAVDQWELVAPLSAPRRSVAVAAHNGRLYAMGGSGHKRISSKVERYNPLTDQWESRRALSTPRFFALLASVGSKLYLLGGATLDSAGTVVCVPKVECYVPLTDTWMTVSGMLEPRAEAGCAVLGSRLLYVVGGYSWDVNRRLASAEVYDPETDAWSRAPPMAEALTGVGCCTLTVYESAMASGADRRTQEEEAVPVPAEDETSSPATGDDCFENDNDSVANETTQLLAPTGD